MLEVLLLLFAWIFAKFHYIIPFNPIPSYFVCRRGFLVPLFAILLGIVVDGIFPFSPWISPVAYLVIYFVASYLAGIRGAVFFKTVILLVFYSLYEILRATFVGYGIGMFLLLRITLTGGLIFYAFARCGSE